MGKIDVSAIAPDESNAFLNQQETNLMFGSGNIGPDRIRLSIANMKLNGLAQNVNRQGDNNAMFPQGPSLNDDGPNML